MTVKPAKQDTPQSQAFKEAARAAECDEDEKAFEARLKRVAKATPKQEPKEPAK